MRVHELLEQEFTRRRAKNSRFSVRAFARLLGISHSDLSRLRRSQQRPSAGMIARLGQRLGWTAAEMDAMLRDENLQRLQTAASTPGFVADLRKVATRTN